MDEIKYSKIECESIEKTIERDLKNLSFCAKSKFSGEQENAHRIRQSIDRNRQLLVVARQNHIRLFRLFIDGATPLASCSGSLVLEYLG